MNKINTIFWDLDGTIINSEEKFYTHTLKHMALTYGLKLPKCNTPGVCLHTIWESMCDKNQLTFSQFAYIIQNQVAPHIGPRDLRPGISHIVKALHDHGYTQAVVSNSMSPFVVKSLVQTNIFQYIDYWVGRDMVSKGKPDPEPYLKCLSDMRISSHSVLAIEDSIPGLQAAQKANIKTVAFPNRMTRDENFKGSEYITDDITYLTRILDLKFTNKKTA